MNTDKMSWVEAKEKEIEATKGDGYLTLQEGDNRIQLLTHCAPLPQVWTGTQYRVAEEGDKNVSVKGVCWVLHDGRVKQAKLPYTVVKAVRDLMQDPDYAFEEFPMPRQINIKAKNAGTKEVEYSVIPSPREVEVPQEILDEVAKKPTPEDVIELIKGRAPSSSTEDTREAPVDDNEF
jgi:hypothetical protein